MTMQATQARMLQLVAAAALLAIALGMPAAAQAGSPHQVSCHHWSGGGSEPAGRYCHAPATIYPNVRGWFGYVGHGGGPCGPTVPGTPPLGPDDPMGICVMPEPMPVWNWTGTGWSRTSLEVGTRTYVHPWTEHWRWIWLDGQWSAIRARDLRLVWRTG